MSKASAERCSDQKLEIFSGTLSGNYHPQIIPHLLEAQVALAQPKALSGFENPVADERRDSIAEWGVN